MLKVIVPKTYVDQINNEPTLASSVAYIMRALYESFDDVYSMNDEYTWDEIEDLYTALLDICAACAVATDNAPVSGFLPECTIYVHMNTAKTISAFASMQRTVIAVAQIEWYDADDEHPFSKATAKLFSCNRALGNVHHSMRAAYDTRMKH